MPAGSLTDNMNALKEHFTFAKSINHDVNTLYPEYIDSADEYDEDEEGEYDEDEYDENDDDEDDDDDDEFDEEIASYTDEAIALAEAGDLVGSLKLFKKAVELEPQNPKSYENLGVTQMRLGLLNKAKKTFEEARKLLNGQPLGSLQDNFNALDGHISYAQSIEHDFDTLYPEHSQQEDDDGYNDDDDYDDEYNPDEEDEEDTDEGGSDGAPSADAMLADRITYKAIARANEGNVEEAYSLFQQAVDASPKDGQMWENLGITQIRLSMLEEARESLTKARVLDKSLTDANLESVYNLIESAKAYGSESIEFTNPKAEEAARKAAAASAATSTSKKGKKKSRQTVVEIGRFSDEDDDSEDIIDTNADDENNNQNNDEEENFFGIKKQNSENEFNVQIDLSQSLGIGLTRGARIDHIKKGKSQFDHTNAKPGDRIVAVESSMVYTLDHFKKAISNAKNDKKTMITITVKQNGRVEDDEDASSFNKEGNNEFDEFDELDEKTKRKLLKIQRLQNKIRNKGKKKNNQDIPEEKNQDIPSTPDQSPPTDQNSLDMNSENVVIKAAVDFVMAGKFEEALPLFVRVAQLSPNKVNSFINLGNIQRDTGRYEDALISYQKGFSMEPNNELLISNYEQFKETAGSAFKSLEVEVNAHSDVYEAHNIGLIHQGNCGGHMVKVGDRVQVKDSEASEWGMGTVDSVNTETGNVEVTKDDWDISYEWEQCKFMEEGNMDEVEPDEQVIWQSGDGTPPQFEGTVIFEPTEISKIVKYKVNHVETDDESENSYCGSQYFHVIYDKNNDIMLVTIDSFFSDYFITKLKNDALGINKDKTRIKWDWAFVHPAQQDPSDARKGNGFPGKRSQNLPFAVTSRVRQCLKPIMNQLNDFDFDNTRDDQTLYGLVHEMDGDVGWLDSQRLPHNDVRWDLGTKRNGHVPRSFASVLPLTTEFNESGTGLWYEKSTGYSLLKTVDMNNRAQGAMNPHVKTHLHPEINLYNEIQDPDIHSSVEHIWAKCIMIAQLRFNRFALYDGRRLHQQYVTEKDNLRLSINPSKGRLTMNSFFWEGP